MKSSIGFRILLGLVLVLSIPCGLIGMDGDGRGHRHGGGGGGGGGGHNFLGISPAGITYGYSDRNFGFAIGPVGGGAFNNGYGGGYSQHYHSPPVYSAPPVIYSQPAAPVYSQPIYSESYGTPGVIYNSPIESGRIISTQPVPTTSGPTTTPSFKATPSETGSHRSVLVKPKSSTGIIENFVTNETAREYFEQSLQAFASGDYRNATRHALHAMLEDGENGKLKLFVSQCQLANGDFEAAAAHLYQGLEQLPEDEWGLVVKNFRQFYKQNDYVPQFDKLVKFTQENDSPAYASALRAYHYFYLGHAEAAAKQLQKSLEKSSQDPLATKLQSIIQPAVSPLKAAQPLEAPTPESGSN